MFLTNGRDIPCIDVVVTTRKIIVKQKFNDLRLNKTYHIGPKKTGKLSSESEEKKKTENPKQSLYAMSNCMLATSVDLEII